MGENNVLDSLTSSETDREAKRLGQESARRSQRITQGEVKTARVIRTG